jgi:hypothetical protein
MMNYSEYRLRSKEELRQLEQKLGDKYTKFRQSVLSLVNSIPLDAWFDLTKSINEKNMPVAIKIICDYIDRTSTIDDFVEFNTTFSMIRRKKTIKMQINTYYESRKKKQNNSSCSCR